MMDNEQFLAETKDFFAGAFSLIDDDLPDGAFFQVHIDTAEAAIDDCCDILEVKRPKNIDGHDIVSYYFEHKE
jgi:hypothetical protein